jgi:hypothetical protein
MTFEELLKEIDKTKLGQLSREDIEKFVEAQERVIHSLARENNSLKNKAEGETKIPRARWRVYPL